MLRSKVLSSVLGYHHRYNRLNIICCRAGVGTLYHLNLISYLKLFKKWTVTTLSGIPLSTTLGMKMCVLFMSCSILSLTCMDVLWYVNLDIWQACCLYQHNMCCTMIEVYQYILIYFDHVASGSAVVEAWRR